MDTSTAAAQAASRASLTVERHYVPRTAPRSSRTTTLSSSAESPQPVTTSRYSPALRQEQPSPGVSSINSHSPNGYVADYSVSEVSSLAGSVSSMPGRQLLDPSKLSYSSRYMPESADSGMYSTRVRGARGARGYPSSTTSYTETDLDSVSGEKDSRYKGELFQPKAAPRIVQKEVRQMYGEVHPKYLPVDELPALSSGDELETMSEASVPSFTDVPRARPRASLRRKKLAELNSGFISEDNGSISSQLDRSKSLPRSILKNNSLSTDISDAESLATSCNFRRTASGRTVRFQHNDKSRTIPKKVIDYEKLDRDADSADSSLKKKRKSSASSDPFSVIKPVSIKPARNDPKRSSGRNSERSGTKQGRQSRSSSTDKARHGSITRGQRSGSGRGRSSSADSRKRTLSADRSKDEPAVSVSGENVKIQMPETNNSKPKAQSMMQELTQLRRPSSRSRPRDTQKMLKWGLIIGVPSLLLVIVIAVVVAMFARG